MGLLKKIFHIRKKSFKHVMKKKLSNIENCLMYQKFYTEFKQRNNIEIPSEVCGLGNHFELVKIKLKELTCICNLISYPIKDTPHYQYLKSKNPKIYLNFLNKLKNLNIISDNSLTFSVERFDNLFKKIKQEGYCPDKAIICINEKNIILDGLHRASILMYLNGGDYEIPVIKVSKV